MASIQLWFCYRQQPMRDIDNNIGKFINYAAIATEKVVP
jgi:hypothetical protein